MRYPWYDGSMNMEKLKELVEKDIAIDNTELGDESTRIPQLHNKYLIFFRDEKLILHKLFADMKVLKKTKWEWFTGKMSAEELQEHGWEPFQLRIMRQDLGLYVDADPDLIEMEAKVEMQKEKVNYLESTLKIIVQRHWMIRNAIEWRKFTQGIV